VSESARLYCDASKLTIYQQVIASEEVMAYPYRSILNPIQFDDPSLLGLGLARQIAQRNGAMLHLLHVVPKLPAFGESEVTGQANSPEEKRARMRLASIAAEHLAGVKYEIHTASASSRALAKAVVRVAQEVDADLIVLKTQDAKVCRI
jgi:nucleotide-binding universal stress UspA family protein